MIFPLFGRKKEKKSVPRLSVDLHSHLIPGIDDGSQNMKESMELLRGMEALGYTKVITTPHIMLDAYKNTAKSIRHGLALLKQEALKENIGLEIEAAAEYYLDDGFYDLLKKGEMLTMKGGYLLFETSYVAKPMHLEEMIFEISAAGYTPLFAHPERYRYIKNPDKEFKRLKDLGVHFQVNLNSFGGHYGKGAKLHADFLSKEGLIDFLGSDVHHKKQVDTLAQVFQSDAYGSIFANNTIRNDELD
ncbi:CpsB/CapC family capsule biosynthesis tyrosine phosphatase [Sulfurovum sp.]|uniref:tyrosine-protein phosphatase n=1 Tax=Sulfurovum sp. TaxID=1969726 RepID=UPI002867FD81|nr:CpsB/CapC family capsule biosynthesis tyrosine phosphatase [Sulfurovum sp.]